MTETPTWTRADASSLQLTPATVTPVIESPDSRVDDDLHVWDTWLLRERDGSVVKIDGSAYRRPGARMLVAPSGKGPPRRSAPSAADVSKARWPGRRRP